MVPELQTDRLGDHVDRLYRSAWALCGSREDAEDLVQETYARVLAKPRDLEGDEQLGYLLRVLRNTFVDTLRRRSRRPATTALPEGTDPPAPAATPHDAVLAREVFAAIAALPEGWRDAVVAVDVMGLSYAEAAEALDVPAGTIMSRLSRARGRVAEAVG
jgi:RNA polymerase sigma-70 factor, ECF subfamily